MGTSISIMNSERSNGASFRRSSRLCCLPLCALALCVMSSQLWADISLPALISDHAVSQKSAKTNVLGKADPGEKITVTLGSVRAETTAGPDGKWNVGLDLISCDAGPFGLLIEGKNKLAIKDVVVGEVWVCSGQSNMEFTLNKTGEAAAEIPKSSNPLLRQFLVTKKSMPIPQEDCKGEWSVAAPTTVGAFTAVGYYFGKNRQQELKVPVSLINSSWGGSIVEAWSSEPTLDQNPDLKAKKDEMLAAIKSLPERMEKFQNDCAEWVQKYQREDKANNQVAEFAGTRVDTQSWQTVKLPGELVKAGLPDAGAIWIRRNVSISPKRAGRAVSNG